MFISRSGGRGEQTGRMRQAASESFENSTNEQTQLSLSGGCQVPEKFPKAAAVVDYSQEMHVS